jgi:hypothetical protein
MIMRVRDKTKCDEEKSTFAEHHREGRQLERSMGNEGKTTSEQRFRKSAGSSRYRCKRQKSGGTAVV